MLNAMYTKFDKLSEEHRVYKVISESITGTNTDLYSQDGLNRMLVFCDSCTGSNPGHDGRSESKKQKTNKDIS